MSEAVAGAEERCYVTPAVPPITGNVRRSSWRNGIVAVLLALGGGALVALAPWWAAVGLLPALAIVAMIAREPFFGLMLTLAFAVQAIPGAHVPALPLGGALIHPDELCFMLTLASCAVNVLTGRLRIARIDIDLTVLTILTLLLLAISIGISKFYFGQKDFVFPALRNFMAIALLPLLPSLLVTRERVAMAENCFIAFGVLLALFIAVQAFTSIPMLTGRLEDLGLAQTTGVTRTVLWGPELMMILALFLVGRDGLRSCFVRVWPVPAVAILLLGLMGTYTRSFWVATLFSGCLLAWLSRGVKGLMRLVLIVLPVTVVLITSVLVVNPRIGEAAMNRAFGITEEIESGDSFGWRGKENALALESIRKHPLLGIGFNGVYKPSISTHGHFEGEEIYIHNAYLYFQLKMGVLGSLILLAFLVVYVRLTIAAHAIADPHDRLSALSYAVLGVVVLMIGYSGQTLSRFVTLQIICLMFSMMRFYSNAGRR